MTPIFDDAVAVGVGGTAFETALAVSQTNEVMQTIQIGLSIITFIVTLGYTIWKWYKHATREDSDGGKNITKKEIEDLIDEVKKEEDKSDDKS